MTEPLRDALLDVIDALAGAKGVDKDKLRTALRRIYGPDPGPPPRPNRPLSND